MTPLTTTLEELNKESRMGATGVESHSREVRRIDLTDFAARKAQIANELWDAAVDVGFFQLMNLFRPPAFWMTSAPGLSIR